MNRRTLLLEGGTTVTIAIAGCSSDAPSNGSESDDGNGDDRTDTAGDNGAQSDGGEGSRPPKITAIALISDWEQFGDVSDNAFPVGSLEDENCVGFRFRICSHDGEIEYFYRFELYGPDDVEYTRSEETITDSTGEDGWETYEQSVYFVPAEDWPSGEYRAEVTVRDEVSGDVSDPESGTFHLAG